ncbi:phage virion morphogenesis protein [Kushneria phosphatilytica]|uniref:Phage virion morphogenesis protein n=1 Tax=Kushneria phosphatilytica TaxID=657387 RepID=A0A1S1NXR5_9GAMM|nr:phage virion morphogenesis protein [Kushneria phosphatilytica]OHV11203.1 phage virion morphogenesis protein [Kushneria phosphatilytica]QEL12224.1 phage virion morphogenesis protein [Kushneria phosphatilytica]
MASDDMQQLDDWLAPLIARLDAHERRRLARVVATDLRRAQRERIKRQQNPDGSDFAPRKSRDRQGAIRRGVMFSKLRTAKYLRTRTSPDGATVGFFGRVASIARTHQYGLRDRVTENGPRVKYAQRELLGFSEADREHVRDLILDHLGGAL